MALCSSKFEKFVLIFFYGTDLSIITLSFILLLSYIEIVKQDDLYEKKRHKERRKKKILKINKI